MWERLWAKVRRVFVIVFVVIWTATGAQLIATGKPDSEIFWVFYVAVWVWYLVTVLVPDWRGRRARARYSEEVR